MKKFTLILVACMLTLGLSAQQFTVKDVYKAPSKLNITADKSIDTIYAPVFYTGNACADTLVYYNVGTGYLTGNGSISGFGMTECSQAFDNSSNGTVLGGVVLFNLISGSTGTFNAKAYSVDGTQKPSTALATSDNIDISTLTIGDNQAAFTFASAPAVTGNFAISIVYPTAAGDTIAVYQTGESCVDAAKDQYAYVNITGMGWYDYKTLMSGNGMGSFDLFIIAVVSSAAEIQENPLAASLNIYPNPATDHATIVCLSHIQNVKVMNCLGQTVVDNAVDGLVYNLNTTNLDNGMYIAEIVTDKGVITKKFTVNK